MIKKLFLGLIGLTPYVVMLFVVAYLWVDAYGLPAIPFGGDLYDLIKYYRESESILLGLSGVGGCVMWYLFCKGIKREIEFGKKMIRKWRGK